LALASGTRLGPYEILTPLGAGGMGEVYRARDARLGRDVAIKVLPPDVARDADRRARFEREARAVAALSHPNILALHDIGVEDDQLFVVTELLVGQSLAERLAEGAVPVRKAVEIAVAIARGLAAAHGKGIAHRDLKPANVFLLADAQVKILDFGLARSVTPDEQGTTHTYASTNPGTILGTAGYMAPEQVRGQQVDGRADLFALGVVLYEMITGQQAFARDSTVETLNAILKEEPPELMTTRADLPPTFDRIVRHCLEKNPAQRFQSAHDVIFALETLAGSSASVVAGVSTAAALPKRALTSGRVAWTVAAIATAALVAALVLPRRPAPDARTARFLAIGAPHQRFFTHAAPAISPDGTTVAFWAPDVDGRIQLWVRDLGTPQPRVLPNTVITEHDADGLQVAFSPDGRALVAFMGGKLKRISLDGGSPQTLADASQPRGATWGVTGQIVYQPAVGGALYVIAASGGTPRPLPEAKPLDDRRAGPRHPFFLPDGKHFLFSDLARIYVTSVDGGQPQLLVEAGSRAEYAAGRLLYVKDGSLLAQPFDPASRKLSGDPQRVVERVGSGATSSVDSAFSVSTNGTLAYWEGRSVPLADIVWLDRAGRRLSTLGKSANYNTLSATADMTRIATEQSDRQTNWYAADIVDVQRGVSNRISLNQIDRVNALTPMLSRDGSHLWFSGAPGIFRLDVGRELPQLIGVNQGVVWLTDVSSDGKWLLYMSLGAATAGDIWALPLSGDPKPVPWLQTPAHEVFARFSPDAKWIAFVQRDADGYAVYLDAFPTRGQRQRVSPGSGQRPMWSSDGRSLFYLTSEFRMMEVQVAPAPEGLRVSPPVELFRAPTPNTTIERVVFWPSPDSQRFLYVARQDEAIPRTINIVLDWPALLSAPVRSARMSQ
jgi:eukaryotic-like serine/threonine-protein kinase